jgi:hypothetical protein
VIWSIVLLLVNLIDQYVASSIYDTGIITYSQYIQTVELLDIVPSLFLIIFALLDLGAMIRMRSMLLGNRLGIAGGLTALIASLTGTINYVSVFLGLNVTTIQYPSGATTQVTTLVGIIAPSLYEVLLVISMVLVGSFFLLNHHRFAGNELWFATGMVYLLAASGIFGVFYYPFFIITYSSAIEYTSLLLVGGAMGTACFVNHKSMEE